MGTAVGSPMAPAYASLFMDKFEQDFIQSRSLGPSTWLRLLGDIFMVWDHSLESLHSFIDALNSFHPSIKFTYSISTKKINFLDVTVSKSENLDFITDVYLKSKNVHQYVEYSSCHPKSCKNGIPYSQGKRYRRIISNDTKFQDNILQLRDFFLERNYPESIVDEALGNVSSLTQDDALQTSVKSGDFVIEYNLSLSNIGLIINKYWDLLQDQDSLLVKRRNDNHSPGPVIRELVPSSHQRSELSNTILYIFSGWDQRIGEGIPIPDSLGEKTTFINICIGNGSLKCHRVLVSTTPRFGDKVICWYTGFTFKTFI